MPIFLLPIEFKTINLFSSEANQAAGAQTDYGVRHRKGLFADKPQRHRPKKILPS
jgi:hypothetical protein